MTKVKMEKKVRVYYAAEERVIIEEKEKTFVLQDIKIPQLIFECPKTSVLLFFIEEDKDWKKPWEEKWKQLMS
jgi:hypothetical protein